MKTYSIPGFFDLQKFLDDARALGVKLYVQTPGEAVDGFVQTGDGRLDVYAEDAAIAIVEPAALAQGAIAQAAPEPEPAPEPVPEPDPLPEPEPAPAPEPEPGAPSPDGGEV